MKVLVTGAAGFIGMHAARRLLDAGHEVIGVDNLNDYYSVSLKRARLEQLTDYDRFHFMKADVADAAALSGVFRMSAPQRVLHLAAQAGVRHSVTHPHAYVQSNLVGFGNVLEDCRKMSVEHLVYASSSSVYGGNTKTPFNEQDGVDHPISFYAATKKANELMAHAYSHLHGLPTTGLRFFTVYGPWGRPDMSPMLFAKAILDGEPIEVFNHGRMVRDFTYVDDVIDAVVGVLYKPPHRGEGTMDRPDMSDAPYRVFNIGNSQPVQLMEYIATLEQVLGRRAEKVLRDLQPGDVVRTNADSTALESWIGVRPSTPLHLGLKIFADWYTGYFEGNRAR